MKYRTSCGPGCALQGMLYSTAVALVGIYFCAILQLLRRASSRRTGRIGHIDTWR
jgi:hypothetical protein